METTPAELLEVLENCLEEMQYPMADWTYDCVQVYRMVLEQITKIQKEPSLVDKNDMKP